ERPPRLLRHTPCDAAAVVRLPALFRTEQRAAVATHQRVDDVPACVVETQDAEEPLRTDLLRAAADRRHGTRIEVGHAFRRQTRCGCREEAVVLALHQCT